jgi:membrane protein
MTHDNTDRRDEGPWAWASPGAFWGLLRSAAHEYLQDKVPRLGAALSFYSILSLAPLLIIAIAIASMAFGEEAVRGQLAGQLRGMVGREGAEAIQGMLKGVRQPGGGAIATILGIGTLLFAASGVFGELQDAMNTIWEVQTRPGRGLIETIKDRFLSVVMVLGSAFLLLVSLILSAAITAVLTFLGGLVPLLAPIVHATDLLVSFVVVTLLFASIFKFLPDARVSWRDVWVGAVLTAILFLIGKTAIGVYLGRSNYASYYGTAGSLVVLLAWIYYSAQILYYGAEFTKVYSNRYGSPIRPAANAEPVTAEARAQQGILKRDGHS